MAAAKSDEFDAYVLADTLRHQHAQWRPLTTPSPALAELIAVSRDRQRILDMQVDTENRLRAMLDLSWVTLVSFQRGQCFDLG